MPSERQELLRQYIQACVRDSVLSWNDLASFNAFDKLLKVVARDSKAVFVEAGRKGAGTLTRTIGTSLVGMLEDVVAGRRHR